MAKMKIDMSNVKQFFFEKGEKVGLIGCTALMVLVVGYALYSGMSSRGTDTGKEWDKAIQEEASRLKQRIQTATLRDEDKPPPLNIKDYQWKEFLTAYSYLSMFPMPDKAFTKKLNPYVLPIMSGDDEKLFQLTYYATGTYIYDIDTAAKKATVLGGAADGKTPAGAAVPPGGGSMPKGGMVGAGQQQSGAGNLAKQVRPTRMVVVCAKFPMQEQLEEFRKALRYATLAELLAHRDELPKPLGLEVSRCEILPDGKPVIQANGTPWTSLFKFEKGKAVVAPEIKDMMRRMMIDEDQQHLAAQYVFPGLVTPLPKLAYGRYGKVDLKDFDIKEAQVAEAGAEAPGVNPMGGFQPKGGSVTMPNFGMGGKKGPAMAPMGGGAEVGGAVAGQDIRLQKVLWSKLAREYQDKFNERYNIFDPLGILHSTGDKKQTGGAVTGYQPKGTEASATGTGGVFGWDFILGGGASSATGAAMMGGPMGVGSGPRGATGTPPGMPPAGMPPGEETGDEGAKPAGAMTVKIGDALVRFFDPSVEPGKTYRYTIRVRMANPNYGKKTDVAFQALADQKELDPLPTQAQGWVMTPQIAIPGDYHWYAIDQAPEVKIKGGADYGLRPNSPDTTPIQVHRWSDKVVESGTEYLTCDYAIAERLYVRRGDFIGRQRVMIELPAWRLTLQAWEIAHAAQGGRSRPAGAGKIDPIAAGLPIDLTTTPPALLVDFQGGRRNHYEKRDGIKDYTSGEDTSAVEVLALSPEGRLVVRNSRNDSDPESPAAAERRERFDQWRERLGDLRPAAGAPGGAAVPGMPNPMMQPKGGAGKGG